MIRHVLRYGALRSASFQARSLTTAQTNASKQLNPDVAHNRTHSIEEGYVWKSGYEPIVVPDLTLDEYVWKNVAKWENKIAIVSFIPKQEYINNISNMFSLERYVE